MSLKVKFYSLFRINLKSKGEEYDLNNTINILELLKKLDKDYDNYFTKKLLDDNNEIDTGSIILVNGKNIIHLNGLNTELTNNDTVTLFPPSAGG